MRYQLVALSIAFSLASPLAFAEKMNSKCSDDASFPEVNRQELTEMVSKKAAFVIDVNSKQSYDETHVPGAIHFASTEKNFAKALPKDKDTMIVAYCGGPQCTAWKKAAEKACKMGYTQIRHFKGGIKEWKEANPAT